VKQFAKWGWIGLVGFGLALFVAGLFMVAQGMAARGDVRDTLAEERIVTAQDADIPLAPVTGPDEARAQADVIQKHIMQQTGGRTFAELERNDPLRATYLQSVTLRTALMQSYMAFKVADLVMGMGALVAVLGLSQAVLGLYLGFVVVRRPQPSVDNALHPENVPPPPNAAWTGTGRSPQAR
jgi:hypothetical protein